MTEKGFIELIDFRNYDSQKEESTFISEGERESTIFNINEINEKEIKKLAETQDIIYKEKTCSLKEGSVQGSVFTLSSIAFGIGAFSLPIRCAQIGCFWYLIAIIFGGMVTYWTISILVQSALTVNGEEYSTSVKRIIGKIPAIIIDIIILINIFGVIIQYMVIVYALFGRTYYEFFIDKEKYIDFDLFANKVWNINYIKYPIMFGLTFLICPICLLKDISKMRFVSLFGICAFIYSVLMLFSLCERIFFSLD